MVKAKRKYVCQACGSVASRWQGQCEDCKEWNTLAEEAGANVFQMKHDLHSGGRPVELVGLDSSIALPKRTSSGIAEFDRALGGGLVPGSLVLIGGEPGIGKSTLVLQVVLNLKGKRTLYISGEESVKQLKLRAERLKYDNPDCFIVSETSLEQIFVHIQNIQPDVVIVDSIQTVSTEMIESSPGSVSQVRECAAHLLKFCKYNR